MKKTILSILLGLIVIIGTAGIVYGVSRHTKDQAPVRKTITIAEGATLTETITCYDPDGDVVTLTVEDLPLGATVSVQVTQPQGFNDPNLPPVPADAPNVKWYTRELSWTPNWQQAGNYTIYIHAVDSYGDDDWVKYEIIVTNSNRPPVL